MPSWSSAVPGAAVPGVMGRLPPVSIAFRSAIGSYGPATACSMS
jgi:hypothetical protein